MIMKSLVIEVVFCLAFIYLWISTFITEFFGGLLRSFACVLFPESFEGPDKLTPLAVFYYSYIILLSLIGNIMFVLSLIVYRPQWHTIYKSTVTPYTPPANANNRFNTSNPAINANVIRVIQRPKHICYFTRYDLYASLVVIFICVQLFVQYWIQFDDFKPIEEKMYLRTVANNLKNYTDESCYDEWCDSVVGRSGAKLLNQFQKENKCCGWNHAMDWIHLKPKPTNGTEIWNKHLLPDSCCSESVSNCSVSDVRRFHRLCRNFEHPMRAVIDPTRYEDYCYGIYPIFKLLALIVYQFSFRRVIDGSARMLRISILSHPSSPFTSNL